MGVKEQDFPKQMQLNSGIYRSSGISWEMRKSTCTPRLHNIYSYSLQTPINFHHLQSIESTKKSKHFLLR